MGFLLMVMAGVLPVSAEDWNTADGKTYKDVVVIALEDDGVRVTYTGGAGILPYYELPLDVQKRFGQDIDSLEAKRKAAEKHLAEAIRKAAEQKKQQEAAAAAAAAAQLNAPLVDSGQPVAPPATDNNQPVVNPPSTSAHPEAIALYPGSKFQYEKNLNVCYLDSPTVDVFPVLPEAAEGTPITLRPSSLTLRITTYGSSPEAPDQIDANFLSVDPIKNLATNRKIQFLVDGAYVPIVENDPSSGDVPPAAGQAQKEISFNLSPKQGRLIFMGHHVNLIIGSNEYRFEPTGLSTLQKYFDDVDRLPPPSFSLGRSYSKLVAKLPSIITMISTVCEYIILGGFGILMMAGAAAVGLGISRFLKL